MKYGWLPDRPDHRDKHRAPRLRAAPLPQSVDLRSKLPGCYNQGNLGSCTANAIAAAIQFDEFTQQGVSVMPSRLFIYWGEREMEGNEANDSGAFIRDGIKFVNTAGVCPEENWPYDESQFATRPPQDCWDNATEKAMLYERLDNTDLSQLLTCLADGLPFVFGFWVYESFESAAVAKSGRVPMPSGSDAKISGHAVLAVGYDASTHYVLVRNSWGTNWGINGHFWMPFAYITSEDLAADFWTIQRVGNVQQSNNPPLPAA